VDLQLKKMDKQQQLDILEELIQSKEAELAQLKLTRDKVLKKKPKLSHDQQTPTKREFQPLK
jgi:hypothetical protein